METKNMNEDIFNKLWGTIASYMDDSIREHVHCKLALYTNKEFLKRYLELDSKFQDFLVSKFEF